MSKEKNMSKETGAIREQLEILQNQVERLSNRLDQLADEVAKLQSFLD